MRESALVAFYRGGGRDHRGRLLDDIHAFDFYELESSHDYIQWRLPECSQTFRRSSKCCALLTPGARTGAPTTRRASAMTPRTR